MRARPSIERIKEMLRYDPETGHFWWLVAGRGRRRLDRPAGALSHHGYLKIGLDCGHYYAHHLAWVYVHGTWPIGEIDHIDGNGLNNALPNLRQATPSQNTMNRRTQSNNTSGVKGVWLCPQTGRWHAYIKANRVRKFLGSFGTREEAAAARFDAEHHVFGEFRRAG